ncbi:MAG: class I SAM-dependent methyltransferase [Anaerolineae bacterium]
MIKDEQDAFGHAFLDMYEGRGGREITERDDGFMLAGAGQALYFSEYDEWPEAEKQAMEHARGRVLDIGCGAGRHALYLQDKGLEVLGIDNSPNAIKVCRARGLKETMVLSITQVSRRLGTFDTILMMGNNFGLVGNPLRARWILRRFHGMISDRGRIIAQNRDPYQTDEPEHLEYHDRNRARGRPAGQVRVRVRYRKHVTPWMDLLFVSPDEMREILAGTGWRFAQILEQRQQGNFIAILEKTSR